MTNLKYNNIYNTAVYCQNKKSNNINDVNNKRLDSIESNLEKNDNTMLNTKSRLDNIEINSYIDFDIIDLKNKWQEHKKGKRNWGKYLWSHFILQDWFDNVFKK